MNTDDRYADDAWKQYYDLLNRFTQAYEVRTDIEVIAKAWDRSVEVILWDEQKGELVPRKFKSTGNRNISTMRELAACLNAACDFVEEMNPEWGSHPTQGARDPKTFLIED